MPKVSQKPVPVQQEEQLSESYISVGLGLLVVVVVGILLYNYFTQKSGQKENSLETQEKLAQEATMSAKPGSTYTVVEGDTLWSISEKSYKTGYNWVEIAKANNLSENDQLVAGQQIVIPEISPVPVVTETVTESAPVVTSTQPTQVTSIQGSSYKIVEGDTLWDIACRAYGDCYAWAKIAQANSVADPDLIYPDTVLTLPR